MSIYDEGDLIEAVKGKARVTDVATRSALGLYLPNMRGQIDLDTLEDTGWTLTVLEKAAPPVPTEPGWYESRLDDQKYLWQLSERGCGWYYVGNEYRPQPDRREPLPGIDSLTRLEPVPVTVQKVIDYLVDAAWVRSGGRLSRELREHFGVTS